MYIGTGVDYGSDPAVTRVGAPTPLYHQLQGRVGGVYLFSEAFKPTQMSGMWQLGANYMCVTMLQLRLVSLPD